jgi:hypothetical protein
MDTTALVSMLAITPHFGPIVSRTEEESSDPSSMPFEQLLRAVKKMIQCLDAEPKVL